MIAPPARGAKAIGTRLEHRLEGEAHMALCSFGSASPMTAKTAIAAMLVPGHCAGQADEDVRPGGAQQVNGVAD
jgi:hypothetical protein